MEGPGSIGVTVALIASDIAPRLNLAPDMELTLDKEII